MTMRKPLLILLALFFCLAASPFVQADQVVPFFPPNNVTGNYTFSQGNDIMELNTNFPISSQDIVYPEWLFALMVIFIFITILISMFFVAKNPAPWVPVIACGIFIFCLSLAAGEMVPLVGYTQVFHQIIPTSAANGSVSLNATNTIYVNEVIVYTQGLWEMWALRGLAIIGFIIAIAGFLLQMKEAKRVTDAEQAQKIRDAEDYQRSEQSIQWRKRDRL